MEERVCYVCRKKLPLTKEYFYRNRTKKEGFELRCKDCAKRQNKKYRDKKYRQQSQEEINIKQRKNRRERLKNGLCEFCKNKRLEHSNNHCEKHYLQNLSKQHLGTTKYWRELKDLLISQSYKCKYSGEELILGLNASIDHIKPLSKYPDEYRELENLQWVIKEINVMKKNFTEEEFLNIISKIYNYSLNK